jgi:uncharacterized membrane protein
MDQKTSLTPTGREQFHAVLLPHRSLGRKGFLTLMALVGTVSSATGLLFYSIGAWPVAGFMGLDVLLLYGAFRLNYRDALLSETIKIDDDALTLTRIHPSGRRESWSFNPYWVRIDLTEPLWRAGALALRSHGRRHVFGNFLTEDEKRAFAAALGRALYAWRDSPLG